MKPGNVETIGRSEAEENKQAPIEKADAATDANLVASTTQEVVVISDTEEGIADPHTVAPPSWEAQAKDTHSEQNDTEPADPTPSKIAKPEEPKPQPATSAAGGSGKRPPENPSPTPAGEDGGEKEGGNAPETPPPNDSGEDHAPEKGEKAPEIRIHVSEPRTRLENIEREVGAAGVPLDQATVVGSGAIEAALGDKTRPHNDTDLMVSEGALRHLREQGDWEESRFASGEPRLTKDGLDVGLAWGDFSKEEVNENAWEAKSGLKVAKLGQVYTWKQIRADENPETETAQKDEQDLELIRNALKGPESKPLDPRVMPREIEFTRNCLPENLRDDPDAQVAIELAANGLHIVRTIYGDKTTGRVNTIVGDTERAEYKDPAAYHEGGKHTPNGMRWAVQHMLNVNAAELAEGALPHELTFQPQDFHSAIVSYAYHDSQYGFNRPNDEIMSSEMARRHALEVGYIGDGAPDQVRDGVLGTIFDQANRRQSGKVSLSPFVRGVTGVDLQGLSEPGALTEALDLMLEDTQARRYSSARTIGKVFREYHVDPHDIEGMLQFIDDHPNLKPHDASGPDDPTIREAAVAHFTGNAEFIDPNGAYAHEYPEDYTLENVAMRHDHAQANREIAAALNNPHNPITLREARRRTKVHADKMREKYLEKKK
jgi:hypothetical protein